MNGNIGTRPCQPSALVAGILAIGMLVLAACAGSPPDSRGPAMAGVRKEEEISLMVLTALAERRGDKEAVMNYRRMGAELGHEGAMHGLGLEFEGQGEHETAAQWFRKDLEASAFPGPSAYRLAESILSGRIAGTPEEAARYMYYAASAGSRQAARRLAELFQAGKGVPRDEKTGGLWLARADRDDTYLPRPMVPPPSGESPRLPVPRTERLRDIRDRAALGSWWAMVQLGAAYETGEDVPRDFGKAEYWYAKAASLGRPSGHYALGAMIANGLRPGTPQEAAALVEFAARAFHPEAEAAFGLALMTGGGVPEDRVEGAYWLTRAALHGNAWGKHLLAKAYLGGLGVPRDEEMGRTLMVEAERAGYRPVE